jgi:hypothetical protein
MTQFQPEYTSPPNFEGLDDIDMWCYGIGIRSGCSGCVHGTQGLCTYFVNRDDPFRPACISSANVKKLEATRAYIHKPQLCPLDYKKEPKYDLSSPNEAAGSGGNGNSVSGISTLQSHAYDSSWGYCDFPEEPWVVDRTLYFVFADDMVNNGINDFCSSVNSRSLARMGLGTIPRCAMDSEFDKECMRLWGSLLCTTRCPEYGRAVMGFCENSYKYLQNICSKSDIVGRCVPDSSVLEPYVVGDESLIASCQDMFEIPVTHTFMEDYGFFRPCEATDCEILDVQAVDCDSSNVASDDCETVPNTVVEFSVIQPACGGRDCPTVIQEYVMAQDPSTTTDAGGSAFTAEDVSCPIGPSCFASLYVSEDTECVNDNVCSVYGRCGCGLSEETFTGWNCQTTPLGEDAVIIAPMGFTSGQGPLEVAECYVDASSKYECAREFMDIITASSTLCAATSSAYFEYLEMGEAPEGCYSWRNHPTDGSWGAVYDGWDQAWFDSWYGLGVEMNFAWFNNVYNTALGSTYTTASGEYYCRGTVYHSEGAPLPTPYP